MTGPILRVRGELFPTRQASVDSSTSCELNLLTQGEVLRKTLVLETRKLARNLGN